MSDHLSIIITHHKTPELLCLCLKSIKDNVKKIPYEIIVVDSESDGSAQELIQEKFFKVKFISFKKNLGYSKIVNTALKKVKGDYILIINADIIVLNSAVSEMLSFMKKNPDVGVVAPQLLDFTNNVQVSCFSKPSFKAIIARRTFLGKTKWGEKVIKQFINTNQNRESSREVDWTQGSAIMVQRKILKKVGLLDQRFFMYFEDADWCRRFWQKGYKVVYLPKAKMAHYYHRSSRKWGPFLFFLDPFLNKHTRTHIISALKYFWKYRHAK
jgi:GT2 family glycosyltransferase